MFKVVVENSLSEKYELPIVQSSIKIKKENNEFKSGFRIASTTRPLSIIENETTFRALGAPDVFSKSKSVFKNVEVFEGNNIYKAVLTVLSTFEGIRKANLKYENIVIDHLENKMHSYFEPVVVNELQGGVATKYENEADDFTDESWTGFVENIIPRNFPDVDFNFPTVPFADLKNNDEWSAFKGEINSKNTGSVYLNNNLTGNVNVIQPFYYLLAPLYKVFKNELGYRIHGSFIDDEINHKRLLEPQSDNLVRVDINGNVIYKHHLTIHPERFLPEWSVSEYLNNLINKFNLKIMIDSVTKSISVDYCETHYFEQKPTVLKNLVFTEKVETMLSSTSNYLLKDASGTDFVNYSLDGIVNSSVKGDYTQEITTAFKAAPYRLNKTWDEYKGVGLFLYDYATNDTYHLTTFDGRTNYLSGSNGVAKNHWYRWFNFRIQAKTRKIKFLSSERIKNQIEKNTPLYIKNQKYLVKSNLISLESNNRYLLELEILSVHN